MAMVTVKYLGSFSSASGKRGERICISDNERVETLLTRLGQKHGRKLGRLLSGEMTALLVNGMAAEKDTILHHGDELTIATLVGGG